MATKRRPWRAGSLSAAERSYPTSEVRGSGLECQAAMAQEQPKGATLHPSSGVAAGRRHPASEVRGSSWEEVPHVQGQWRLGGATSHPMSGVVTLRSHPEPETRAHSREEQPKEWWLRSTEGPRGAIPR